jgi:hypothetical protein
MTKKQAKKIIAKAKAMKKQIDKAEAVVKAASKKLEVHGDATRGIKAALLAKIGKIAKAQPAATKAAVKRDLSIPKDLSIPAHLRVENRKPLTKAQQAAVNKAVAAAKANGLKQSLSAPQPKAQGAAAMLLARLTAKAGKATQRAPEGRSNVVNFKTKRPQPVVPVGPRFLKANEIEPGTKVRVMGWKKPDVLSTETFTIRKLDKGEKTLGPDWFAVDEGTQVHVDWLVAA